jgi:hypothetical protein
MTIEGSRLFPGLDDFVQAQHSADLDTRDLLFSGVVAQFVALRIREDANESGVAVCNPLPENEASNENGEAGEDGAE